MTKKELKKLRSKLPRGYVKKIQDTCGVSTATISRVLRGDAFNQTILDAAINLALTHQEIIKTQQNQINAL
jgi:uncharacterized protein YerC